MEIGRYAGVVLDIDGVLTRGGEPIAGAAEAVTAIRASGAGVVFVTNNASRTVSDVVDHLANLGIPAVPDEVVTSPIATAVLLEPGTRCLIVGMRGLREALRERGCVEVDEPADADAVVVGFNRDLTYDDLRRATLALRGGARFLATNGDRTFPMPEGLGPGNGAIVAALEVASDRRAEFAGKPAAAMYDSAAARLPHGQLLMVGDRLDTDIAGAAALGWETALVLTGVATAEEAAAANPRPTYVATSLASLLG